MHDAFYLSDVGLTIDAGERLTCVTYTGDVVLVGLASGKVVSFRVACSRGGASGRVSHSSQRQRVAELGVGRPVTAIEVAPELGVVLALCDGAVVVLRLPGLERIPSVLEGRHAVAFALDAVAPRLVIATTGKKLKLFDWIGGKFVPLRGATELDVPDVPRAVSFLRGSLLVALAREYNAIAADTGVVTDIAGAAIARDTRPLIKLLPGERILLLCADDVGVAVGRDGMPAPGGPPVLQFNLRPTAAGYCFPYLVVLGEGKGGGGGRHRTLTLTTTQRTPTQLQLRPRTTKSVSPSIHPPVPPLRS